MTAPTVTKVTLQLLDFEFRLDWFPEDDDENGPRRGWCVMWVAAGVDQDIVEAGIDDLETAVMCAIDVAKEWAAEWEREQARRANDDERKPLGMETD